MEKPPAWTGAPCATIAAAHRALVTRATAAFVDSRQEATSLAKALIADFRCAPTATGAWAVTHDALAIDPRASSPALTGKLSLGWYDRTGTRVAFVIPTPPYPRTATEPTTTKDNVWAELGSDMSAELVTFDWSGDGRPEVFLLLTTGGEEDGTWTRGSVWTFDGHAVVEYAPAKGRSPSAVLDIDSDGRPDLVTTPFADIKDHRGVGGFLPLDGPLFVAHSLADGMFALDDDVAKKAASCSCPTRTASLIIPDQIDDAATAAACARVWKLDTKAITSALHASCRGDAGERTTCDEPKVIERIASRQAPVSLP